jgi:hypothetical protein
MNMGSLKSKTRFKHLLMPPPPAFSSAVVVKVLKTFLIQFRKRKALPLEQLSLLLGQILWRRQDDWKKTGT